MLRDQLQASLGNSYTLERELGGGGMSRVFLATEARLGRSVVVKVLPPELAEGLSAERFDREIALAAKLQHPHIVPVLSAGDTKGLPYYTMPFVEGQSLRAKLADHGALPIADAVSILRDIARALAYAHEHGVVHRDIKPENVLLSGGSAVVTDFGIAKAVSLSRTQPDGASLTAAGASLGTPGYMAPEQVSGDPIDHRADIYSFGVVAYELLTGRHVFSGRTSAHQLMAAHVSERPAPVTTLRPDVPKPLAELVARCLAKGPDDRPPSASELIRSLDSVPTPTATPRGVAVSLPGLRRRWVRAGGVLVLLAVVGVITYRATAPRASSASGRGPLSVMVQPFEVIGGDTTDIPFADGLTDQLTGDLTSVPGLDVRMRSSSYTLRQQRLDEGALGRDAHADAVLSASVQRSEGRLRVMWRLTRLSDSHVLQSGKSEREAKDFYAVQNDIAREIVIALGAPSMSTVAGQSAGMGTRDVEAFNLYVDGAYMVQRRGAWVANAVSDFERAIAKDSNFGRAWAGLSEAQGLLLYWDATAEPRAAMQRSLAAAQRAVALAPDLAETHAMLARALSQVYRHDEALREYRKALGLDSNYVKARLWYGQHLISAGRLEEGLAELRRARALDPYWFQAARQLSQALVTVGRVSEGQAELHHAWELDSTNGGVWRDVAMTSFLLGRMDSAKAAMTRALSPPSPNAWLTIYLLGRLGMRDSAVRAIRRLEAQPSLNRPLFAGSLAMGYLGLDDTARALDWLAKSAEYDEPLIFTFPLSRPEFDPLRSNPRFAQVARAFGFDDGPLVTLRKP